MRSTTPVGVWHGRHLLAHASLWGRWAARISSAATLSVITAQDQGTLAPVTGSDTPAFGVEAHTPRSSMRTVIGKRRTNSSTGSTQSVGAHSP